MKLDVFLEIKENPEIKYQKYQKEKIEVKKEKICFLDQVLQIYVKRKNKMIK